MSSALKSIAVTCLFYFLGTPLMRTMCTNEFLDTIVNMDNVLFLSVDSHSKMFTSTYGDIPNLQESMKAIILTDLTVRDTIDLLEVLGVTMFPSILQDRKVYGGSDAFALMHTLTGVSTAQEHVGGSSVQSIRCSQCRDAFLKSIGGTSEQSVSKRQNDMST